MPNYNYSSNKYIVGKKQDQEWIKLKVNNIGVESRIFNIKAYDADSNEALSIYLGDKETNKETVEPNSFVVMNVNTTKAENKIALEVSHNGRGAGISVRQHSSSNSGDDSGIELNLK